MRVVHRLFVVISQRQEFPDSEWIVESASARGFATVRELTADMGQVEVLASYHTPSAWYPCRV
jgi:hypothetical protein